MKIKEYSIRRNRYYNIPNRYLPKQNENDINLKLHMLPML
jgi:hypothetical protein